VLHGEVNPVRNFSRCDSKPSGALPPGIIIKPDSAAKERGIISNGVNIISYCALGSAPYRPVRGFGVLDFKMKSEVTTLLRGS
jgi:hypothetical protein